MADIFQGWQYISAIFNTFCNEYRLNAHDSHISPRFIFRGITKRYFTESKEISALIKTIDGINKDKEAPSSIPVFLKKWIKKAEVDYCAKESRYRTVREKKEFRAKCYYDRFYQGLQDDFKKNYSSSKYRNKIEDLIREFNNTQVDSEDHLDFYADVIDLQVNMRYLKEMMRYLDRFQVSPEQIRSGASVRLRDIEKDYTTLADYLAYVRSLIEGFKQINPDLGDFNELEILAEIQHRGGGSCLVDFSNDFLISLWFAVNNDFKDIGYLFCYDVNADALENDNLTYLSKERSQDGIETLLRKTRKSTRYMSEETHRFWLWRPANINGRIARQDSVFVFGVEKFVLENHDVRVIPIPPKWKADICSALKVYFGTTAEAIYPDIDGYATANSKLAKLPFQTQYFDVTDCAIKNPEYVQKGMSCLLKGDYQLSLDYFQKWIAEDGYANYATSPILSEEKRDNYKLRRINIEVYYSIGFCHKKLGNNRLAKRYFRDAFVRCYNLIFNKEIDADFNIINSFSNNTEIQSENKIDRTAHFDSKMYKVIEDYLSVLLEEKDFASIIKMSQLLLNSIEGFDNFEVLSKVLISIHNNAMLLNCLTLSHKYGSCPKGACKFIENKTVSGSFHYLLNKLFHFIKVCYENCEDLPIVTNRESEITKKYLALMETIDNYKQNRNVSDMIYWNYQVMLDAVKQYWNGDDNAVNSIADIIADLEDLQLILQAKKKV